MSIGLSTSIAHCLRSVFLTSRFLKSAFLSILFGVCFALPFIQHDYFPLGWVAFVPLLFATSGMRFLPIYLLSLMGGIVAIVIGKYWIYNFVVLTQGFSDATGLSIALMYWLYSAHYLVLLMLTFTFLLKNTRIYGSLLFPLCLCITDLYFPLLFPISLADTQAKFTLSLQAIDITGSLGLTFLMGWCNYTIFLWLKAVLKTNNAKEKICYAVQSMPKASPFTLFLPLLVALAAWFSYGLYASSFWEHQSTHTPYSTWGVIQSNEKPAVEHYARYPGYSDTYPPEMDMTERLAAAGAEIVIWPEGQGKGYLNEVIVKAAYHRQLTQLNTSVLFHDFETSYALDEMQKYNAAILLTPEQREPQRYDKIMRVPFGEYMPSFARYTGISALFESSFNIEDSYLAKGSNTGLFRTGVSNTDLSKATTQYIVPLICYETTFPFFVTKTITNALENRPSSTVLVALSNDGWFDSKHQANQHILGSILRGVENRVPLVHVTNNGPSIATNLSGKIIFESPANQAGGFLVNVPHMQTTKPTIFNQYPYALPTVLSFLFVICLLMSFLALHGKRLNSQ